MNIKKIQNLIKRFKNQRDTYNQSDYNETQTRIEFINPFFTALGWDVENKQGLSIIHCPVVHETPLKIGRATKIPDYSFRVGGVRKFFVEAKKPSINLKNDPEPAYQLRRYGWNAKLSLSIITNFAEFAVYDCRIKPESTDKASTARVWYLQFTDYLEHWEELVERFSFDAVWQGKFEQYATAQKNTKGIIEVDTAFLAEIESWRDKLAHNIALRNPNCSPRQLNFAVQQIIDRIVFLRICEDRGIEDYGRLLSLQNGTKIYQRLFRLFREADERYDSGLFHFKAETGRKEPDILTPGLTVDDDILKYILKSLYYPDSPYEFSVLGADILGQVYERFLGKVIHLTEKHEAFIEEKPEVKKAGGVYYTPTYIVDYIVKQTIGTLLQDKKVGLRSRVNKLTILDPACGSGSFLLGAYQFLLDWHLEQYLQNPKKWATGKNPRLYQAIGKTWKLTVSERKRILLNNIYGVDIDSQAVEVTKLSLLLKVLEDEQSVISQISLIKERVLPDIDNNIKCGNSLISNDFYNSQQLGLLDEETLYRINAFDWEAEFADAMKAGGFDVVIGNPPYGAWFQDDENVYFKKYHVFSGVKDVYVCFIEKGFHLLKKNGKLSFIVPSAWTGGPRYITLRSYLLKKQIDQLILLPFDVFVNAYIDTLIVVLSNIVPENQHRVQTYVFGKHKKLNKIQLDKCYKYVQQQYWKQNEDQKLVFEPETISLIQHLKHSHKIKNIAMMKRGVLFDKSLLRDKPISNQYYKYFEGDVYRYQINIVTNQWVPFGNKMREKPKEVNWFQGERILLRRLVNRRQRFMAVLVKEDFITNKNIYVIKMNRESIDIRVLLGILNSRFISFLYLKQVTQATKDDFPQVTIRDILSLPFPDELSDDLSEQMLQLVEIMLTLNQKLQTNLDSHSRTVFKRQIEATDRQIDNLVYQLYDLTKKEIELVES